MPQPRPKFVRATGRTYTPATANDWKHEVRAAFAGALRAKRPQGELLSGPLRLDMVFWLPRPKSHYGTGRNAARLKQSARKTPQGKPDIDNLVKALLDAVGEFQGLPPLLWIDDAQVVEIRARKCYTCHNGHSGASVHVEELSEEEAEKWNDLRIR